MSDKTPNKWIKDKYGSGYTSHDGRREIIKHPKGWIERSTSDKYDMSDPWPTKKEAMAGKYSWAMKEAKDSREYGYEGDMAMSQLKGILMHAKQLHDMLKPNTDLPEWVQSKITLAYDYIQTATDYMSTEMNEEAPTNAAGNGSIDGIGVGAKGEPGVRKTKYQKKNAAEAPKSPVMDGMVRRKLPSFKQFMG